MTEDSFLALDEGAQRAFLLDLATRAIAKLTGHDAIKSKIEGYLGFASRLSDGDASAFEPLLIFIQDPEQKHCFATYTDAVSGDARAEAVVHICSYACAFSLRIEARERNNKRVTSPIVEAVPEVVQFYLNEALSLGL